MCEMCDHGKCPRHDATRDRLMLDPYYEDARAEELEAANARLSVVDFEAPWRDA